MPNRLYHKASALTHAQRNRFLIACLIILLLVALAQLFWAAISTINYQVASPVANNNPGIAQPAEYKVSNITNSDLFGIFEEQASYSENIPTTRLQLTLRGAFTSSNPKLASAIIEGPDGETRSYKVNSSVYGQAKLQQVHGDRVVLSRDGQLETLHFPTIEQELSSSKTNVSELSYDLPDGIRSLVQDNMTGQEIQQAAKELSSATMTPEQRQDLIRQRLQDLRNRARQRQ